MFIGGHQGIVPNIVNTKRKIDVCLPLSRIACKVTLSLDERGTNGPNRAGFSLPS
jgi:hypothetical protein